MNPQPKPTPKPKQQCKCGRISRVVPCAFCKPSKPIARRSTKRAKQERQYSVDRIKFLQDNPVCKIQVDGCTHKATQVHHAKGRIGELLLNQKYWVATCASCHTWAEVNPIESKEIGISISRLSNH